MKHRGLAAAIVLVGAHCAYSSAAQSPHPSTHRPCAITHPKGGLVGNDALAVVLLEHGRYVFQPGGGGFVDHDGALGIKVGWELRRRGTLFVSGRRLDGVAPEARAYIPRSYDDYIGGMSLYLVFPTPGCWEITGTVAGGSLTFVVQVVKIGEGPSWRMQGPPSGWRLTERTG